MPARPLVAAPVESRMAPESAERPEPVDKVSRPLAWLAAVAIVTDPEVLDVLVPDSRETRPPGEVPVDAPACICTLPPV